MASNRPVSKKIQNASSTALNRARWGKPGGSTLSYYGAVTGLQQRVPNAASQWPKPSSPSLETQGAAATRQASLGDVPAAELDQLHAAWALVSEGKDISSFPPSVQKALKSPVLRCELRKRDEQLLAATAQDQQSSEPAALSEKDHKWLHIRPAPAQDELSDEVSARLAACTTRSSKPSEIVAAANATAALNNFILEQVSDAAEEGSPQLALKAVLSDHSILLSEDGLPSEHTMRIRCLSSALETSGLLQQPGQKRVHVALLCGIVLEVVLQLDPWQEVPVLMSGLHAELPRSEAHYIVSSLLQGSGVDFRLSACSAGGEALSGLAKLGIKVMAPSQASSPHVRQSSQTDEHQLVVWLRRDALHLLPPVVSVLMVRPDAPASSPSSVLSWVRFDVDAKEGHTDLSKCRDCGETGHVAAACTMAQEGHNARFQCVTALPVKVAAVPAASGKQQSRGPRSASSSNKNKQKQQSAPVVDADGFVLGPASRRTVNQLLSQQPTTNASVTTATTSSSAAAAQQPTHGTVNAATDAQGEDEVTDAAIIAESEHMERLRQQGLTLGTRMEAVVLCLTEDSTVAAQHEEQFDCLLAQHTADLTAVTAAHARATEAVAELQVMPPGLLSPKGKDKATPEGVAAYEEGVKAFNAQQTSREAQLTAAREYETRMRELLAPLRSFAQKLQQYSDAHARVSSNGAQLSLVHVNTELQLSADSDSCGSLSPVIDIPADSQIALAAVTADALEVGPAVTAVSPQTTVSAAPQPEHLRAQAAESKQAQLEQRLDEQLTSRRDEFDAADQIGVDAEQARLTRAQQSVTSAPCTAQTGTATVAAAVECNTTAGNAADLLDSDTERDSNDSSNSGSSESSESECDNRLAKAAVKRQHLQIDTQQHQQPDTQQQQQQQQQVVAAPAVTVTLTAGARTRSATAKVAKAATLPTKSN
jgi:hypothetical protein